MYERTDKRRIYQLIDLYLNHEIDESTFCDEFYYSFDLELDCDVLNSDEREAFYKLSLATSRFSKFEEDIKKNPGVYYTKDELNAKIKETKKQLMQYFLALEKEKVMLFIEIINPASGTWTKDCEFISLIPDKHGLIIKYRKKSDSTCWSLKCEIARAYKLMDGEFSRAGYLAKLPEEGSFFEIFDSPWMFELKQENSHILEKCEHYVLKFFDKTAEIIGQKFSFEQLKEELNFEN